MALDYKISVKGLINDEKTGLKGWRRCERSKTIKSEITDVFKIENEINLSFRDSYRCCSQGFTDRFDWLWFQFFFPRFQILSWSMSVPDFLKHKVSVYESLVLWPNKTKHRLLKKIPNFLILGTSEFFQYRQIGLHF